MFEEVFYKNTSTSKISSDHFLRFLHTLYLTIYARYLSEINTSVHQRKPTQTLNKYVYNHCQKSCPVQVYQYTHILITWSTTFPLEETDCCGKFLRCVVNLYILLYRYYIYTAFSLNTTM